MICRQIFFSPRLRCHHGFSMIFLEAKCFVACSYDSHLPFICIYPSFFICSSQSLQPGDIRYYSQLKTRQRLSNNSRSTSVSNGKEEKNNLLNPILLTLINIEHLLIQLLKQVCDSSQWSLLENSSILEPTSYCCGTFLETSIKLPKNKSPRLAGSTHLMIPSVEITIISLFVLLIQLGLTSTVLFIDSIKEKINVWILIFLDALDCLLASLLTSRRRMIALILNYRYCSEKCEIVRERTMSLSVLFDSRGSR